ncbi:PA2169 family four-helix-bundle protein [Arenibacter sp. BSSL-BM3]|uniref:PA2169 family four-helix-bundle protein n=1 Tax=Arenibacter arenosicollis TaxID=2762274 RepID=A0ABR7QRF6_9FLAO|nr:PA2169 family four-helix-bundle protein [Arenibacter arenosicollis]MBC8769776.1 PA2169 family four-helix-bundle protein [Arenibacter arenosicollis]
METKNRKLVDQLEEILEKNRDAEKGYRKAAENAESHGLKAFFDRKSNQRKQFNESLKRELVANYDEIDDDGSFTGTMHRAWMDVKAFFSGDNDESMLEEAIRGDKAAVEEYEEVLKEELLPMSVGTIIREQLMKIKADLNQIKSLEDLKD